jgi:hypothetical protein
MDKPTAPGLYTMNGMPCLVALDKGTLKACWIDAQGEFQKARVWDKELNSALWTLCAIVDKKEK